MDDQIFIQHRFTIEKDGQKLTDALVLPKDEYEKLTPEDIEKTKQERFDNWLYAVTHPPVVEEPSEEEKLQQIESDLQSLEEQKMILTSQKAELQTAIAAKPVDMKPVGKESLADQPV